MYLETLQKGFELVPVCSKVVHFPSLPSQRKVGGFNSVEETAILRRYLHP